MLTTQSNTQTGLIVLLAAVTLTGTEGRLIKLADGAGRATAALPTVITDRVTFIVEEGAAIGENASLLPISSERNFRVRAKGTGVGGAPLCLAAIAGDDAGKLRAVPVASGTYHILAIAEEDFVDGQLVLVRFTSREAVVVA